MATDEHTVVIPHDRLSPEVLRAVVEEFVTRDGTDYGCREVALEEKVARVLRQLRQGTVVITYDVAAGTCTLVTKETLSKQ